MKATDDLIILTYADYTRLRQDLAEAGLDLCYMAQAAQPVRYKWSQELLQAPDFLRQVAQRRPAGLDCRIVSVWQSKKATWFQPEQFTVTFHGVRRRQEQELVRYLDEHHIQGSTQARREMLQKA